MSVCPSCEFVKRDERMALGSQLDGQHAAVFAAQALLYVQHGSSLNDGQGDGYGTWTDGRTRSFFWRCLINNHQQQQQHWQ